MTGSARRALLVVVLLTLAATGKAAAAAGSAFDTGMLALMRGDYAEAYCQWKPLAERGHTEAQYHLGWLYANGNGLAVDIGQALMWWRKAADKGYADAQFAVALAYTTGEGIGADLDTAVDWYLVAARQGHQDARDILVRLNGDASVDLLQRHPEIASEPWFGWEATVQGERINLRGGPGTGHKVVGQIEKDARVRVIGSRDDWLMVVVPGSGDGQIAWIYKSLVSGPGS